MQTTQIPDVRKNVTVPVDPTRAFEIFTTHPSVWWPPSHVLLRTPRVGLKIEPGVGGRYLEWDRTGLEAQWGVVTVWEPARRLRFTWRVGADFRPLSTDDGASEIDVSFAAAPGGTRVELAHTELGRLGDAGRALRAALDGESPGETLELFALAVEKLGARP
ncbi:SRPBCC domain-containing protein [Nocardia alba]|uniref:Activator of Hsp90 ATPase-like protein n=1 Tax=Nocardia alba TaxID=225051 RepID=A0A4R1F6H7_9NOCA|nr:SRPBCC domain-containing protein [Nocardia alba]TCJ89887.1 activator of Hsp90 ATPase-like protein [Nocardia alba]